MAEEILAKFGLSANAEIDETQVLADIVADDVVSPTEQEEGEKKQTTKKVRPKSTTSAAARPTVRMILFWPYWPQRNMRHV